jgi:D-glycero-alpha-D-manno-heptose-7-phosphate kinase
VAARQVERIGGNVERLKRMRRLVDEGYEVLAGGGSLSKFGRLLDEGWKLKNSLDDAVSNAEINAIYQRGLQNGALGGKLLGAGGGGFILFFVPPEKKAGLIAGLGDLETISISVNAPGTQIVHASMKHEIAAGERTVVAARAA